MWCFFLLALEKNLWVSQLVSAWLLIERWL